MHNYNVDYIDFSMHEAACTSTGLVDVLLLDCAIIVATTDNETLEQLITYCVQLRNDS